MAALLPDPGTVWHVRSGDWSDLWVVLEVELVTLDNDYDWPMFKLLTPEDKLVITSMSVEDWHKWFEQVR